MEFQFKPGDMVFLTREAVALYGGAWPHFIPEGQGGGTMGMVVEAADRPHKPGAAPRPYLVNWGNGIVNSYRECDLRPAAGEAEEPTPVNITPFRR